jgi:6-phosphogluconolactonase
MAATPDHRRVITVSDPVALARAAAERILARIAANGHRVAICLTGGSSPQKLYQLLATDELRNKVPWQRMHWFIGDERFVGADDPLNNMGVARRTFLDRCAPGSNIHPIRTDTADPDDAAKRYERELKSFYGAEALDPARPLFDIVLMGVGPDGHTASLFPGDPALTEIERWVVGVPKAHVQPFVPRVTLTLPALGSCREMLFEVAGSEKRAILTRVLAGENLPANRAHSEGGHTVWLVDRAALPENLGAP